MATTVYHGAAIWQIPGLLSGESSRFGGLYVTESAGLAQRYADAQVSRDVSAQVRDLPGAAVVVLETDNPITWNRRPINHSTLDTCEATIKTWRVARVIVRTTAYNRTQSVAKIDGRYQPLYPWLRERLGERLEIVLVEDR